MDEQVKWAWIVSVTDGRSATCVLPEEAKKYLPLWGKIRFAKPRQLGATFWVSKIFNIIFFSFLSPTLVAG